MFVDICLEPMTSDGKFFHSLNVKLPWTCVGVDINCSSIFEFNFY